MKQTFYLKHSLMSLYDPRMEKLIDAEGLKGLGAYWFIVELLAMRPYSRAQLRHLKPFCKRKKVTCSYLWKIISNYGLFVIEEDGFFSPAELNPDTKNEEKSAGKGQKSAVFDAKRADNCPKRDKKVPENASGEMDNSRKNSDLRENNTPPIKENTKDIITTAAAEKEKEKSSSSAAAVAISRYSEGECHSPAFQMPQPDVPNATGQQTKCVAFTPVKCGIADGEARHCGRQSAALRTDTSPHELHLFGTPVSALVGHHQLHHVPAALLHPLRVKLADQVATDGIGLSEQGVPPVYGAPIGADAGLLVLRLEDDATGAPPLRRVYGSDDRRNRIDGDRIGAQLADGDLHKALLQRASDAVFPATGVDARHVVFRTVRQRQPAQADAQLASLVQRDARVVQAVGESDVAAVGTHGIVQPDIVVEHAAGKHQLQPRLLQVVHPVPPEHVLLPMPGGTDFRPLALHREAHTGGVSQRIRERIDQPVRALLVDGEQSAVAVGGVEHTQAVARLDERLHVLSVRPRIDVAVLLVGKPVYLAAEHLLAVHLEHHRLHAIPVVHAVHVVVGTDADSDNAPCGHGLRGVQRVAFVLLRSVHHPFAGLREEHDSFGARSGRVLHLPHEKRQRVHIFVRRRLQHIQMQMRSEGVARIAAQGDDLPRLDGIFVRSGDNLHLPALLFVLKLLHPLRHLADKGAEVAVDGGIAIIIHDIEHIARTVGHADARDVSVRQRPHRLADGAVRLEVQSAVKVIGAQLSEVA